MIWIDIATPKYAVFFSTLFKALQRIDENILVTTRKSEGYTEVQQLLDRLHIDHYVTGNYGGKTVEEKFAARLQRQQEFVNLFKDKGLPDFFICGSSVEGIQTAFGLGIPVVHFADTPIRADTFSYDEMTILAKLTIPLSTLILKPFVVPDECYTTLGVKPERVVTYPFIDVSLWTQHMVADPQKDFRLRLGLDTTRPTILVREEEYKAHYVNEYCQTIYESLPLLAKSFNANLILMPRYGHVELQKKYGDYVMILEEKLLPDEFYPFIDLLIGGGGTMNLEAASLGIPVISTRSLKLFHDTYLLQQGMMFWAACADDVLHLTQKLLGTKTIGLNSMVSSVDLIEEVVQPIEQWYLQYKIDKKSKK